MAQGSLALAQFFYIQYPPHFARMVDDIAADIEARSEYPPNIRRKGEINVSAVLQIATQKLAEDCSRVTATEWEKYRAFYLDFRPKRGAGRRAGEKSISYSIEIAAHIRTVIDYLKANGIPMPYIERVVGGKSYPNKPLVVSLAVKYTHDQIKK